MGKEGQAAVLNREELKRLQTIVSSREQAGRNQSMIDFSFRCGLRVKEVSSLYLSDVVGQNGKLKTSFTLERKKTKGNNNREIYLQDKTLVKKSNHYTGPVRDILPRTDQPGTKPAGHAKPDQSD